MGQVLAMQEWKENKAIGMEAKGAARAAVGMSLHQAAGMDESESTSPAMAKTSYSQTVDADAMPVPAETLANTSIEEAAQMLVASLDGLDNAGTRKIRRDKLEQERYYPAYIPTVTALFRLELNQGDSIQWLDAYLLELIYYCESYKADKACTFSSYTIAEKINVSRSSVLRSVKKLERNNLIFRQKVKGVPWRLTIKDSNILPLLDTKSSVTMTPLNEKSSVTVTPLNENGEKKQCHHDTTFTKSSSTMTPLNGKSSVTVSTNKDYIYKDNYNRQEAAAVVAENNSSLYDEKVANCVKLWEDGTGKAITPFQGQELCSLIDDFSYEWTMQAMRYTFNQNANNPWRYLLKILDVWKNSGYKKPWEHESRPLASSTPDSEHVLTQEELDEDEYIKQQLREKYSRGEW